MYSIHTQLYIQVQHIFSLLFACCITCTCICTFAVHECCMLLSNHKILHVMHVYCTCMQSELKFDLHVLLSIRHFRLHVLYVYESLFV